VFETGFCYTFLISKMLMFLFFSRSRPTILQAYVTVLLFIFKVVYISNYSYLKYFI